MNTLVTFFNEALEELRLVRWPTRQQAVRFSGVVIAFVLACAAIFGAIDFGLSELMQAVLNFA